MNCITPEPTDPRRSRKTGKVLVTGRDVNIRSILEYRLAKEGYSVLVSEVGDQALMQARDEQPDLIILDLAAPYTDGIAFLEQVKSASDTCAIPVLVISTFRAEEISSTSVHMPDVQVILMPFSPRQLVADVKATIGPARRRSGHQG